MTFTSFHLLSLAINFKFQDLNMSAQILGKASTPAMTTMMIVREQQRTKQKFRGGIIEPRAPTTLPPWRIVIFVVVLMAFSVWIHYITAASDWFLLSPLSSSFKTPDPSEALAVEDASCRRSRRGISSL